MFLGTVARYLLKENRLKIAIKAGEKNYLFKNN